VSAARIDRRDVIEVYIVPARNGYTVTVIDKLNDEQFREVSVTDAGPGCIIHNFLRHRSNVNASRIKAGVTNNDWQPTELTDEGGGAH
jgi:hypothetical protein